MEAPCTRRRTQRVTLESFQVLSPVWVVADHPTSDAERVMESVADVVCPAVSVAVTVITFVPSVRGRLDTDHVVDVPAVIVAEPLPPRLFVHVTLATPLSSVAVPESDMVLLVVLYVLEVVGDVTVTAGALSVVGVEPPSLVPPAALIGIPDAFAAPEASVTYRYTVWPDVNPPTFAVAVMEVSVHLDGICTSH
jgi:hypothetical protein